MIISNIICTRLIGDDRVVAHKRLWVPLLIGLEAWGWVQLSGISEWFIPLSMVAFPLWRYDGWGEQFLAMHGKETKYQGRNKRKIVTKCADFIYQKFLSPRKTIHSRKVYGMIWGGLRGLYDLPGLVALSILLQNYYIAFPGLLMGLQGVVYYLTARYLKEDTAHSEIAVGLLRGFLWLIAIVWGGL